MILIMIPFYGYGQSPAELDKIKVFDKINLGDDINDYSSDLTKFEYQYAYKNTCCTSIFSHPIHTVFLHFKEESFLDAITIYMPPNSNEDFLTLEFEKLYGKPTGFKRENNSKDYSIQWKSNKVILTVLYRDLGTNKGTQAAINIVSVQ